MRALNIPAFFSLSILTHWFVDQFLEIDTTHWTATAASGAIAVADRPNGGVAITTQAADNAEGLLRLKKETLKFQVGKEIILEGAVSFTDANNNDGAIAFGMADNVGAGFIANGGADLRTGNIDCCVFYKRKGEANWRVRTQRGGAATVQEDQLIASNKNNLTGATQSPTSATQNLRVEVFPIASGHKVVYSINGAVACVHENVAIASSTEMHPAFVVKAGGANAQTLDAHYIQFAQTR